MSNSPYKKMLDEHGFCIISPVGSSMLPLIEEGTDTVKIVNPTFPLKKYDVILYQRPNGKNVLHRIVKVTKHGYVVCGDNQVGLEKYVLDEWIIGVMDGYFKGEVYHYLDDASYIKYSKSIVRRRPLRKVKHMIKKIFKGTTK